MPTTKKTRKSRPTAVDLFAGAGGLSTGLRRAGFNVVAAVEIDKESSATYKVNHPDTAVLTKDVRLVTAEEITSLAGERLDLLAGCAPCQGFCSLTRKYKNRKDPRNDLVIEMASLIAQLKPRLVLMENVPGLLTRGRAMFERFLNVLARNGYRSKYAILQMADYGVPQNRKRLVLVAGKGFEVSLPEPTHVRESLAKDKRPAWVTVRQAIGGRLAPVTIPVAMRSGGLQAHDWHVVSVLQSQTKDRLRQAVPGRTWRDWKESVRPECHRDGYTGFTNTYGRMSWDRVSPTITGGCITPCKGRFGHPDRRRFSISVREAALLQSFPENYQFSTKLITSACDQIGNAVPPRFAEAAGRHLRALLPSLP